MNRTIKLLSGAALVLSLGGYASAGALEELKASLSINGISEVETVPAASAHAALTKVVSVETVAAKAVHPGTMTPYTMLKDLYDSGTPVTEKDLAGWLSGRSVFFNNRIEGTLVAFKHTPDGKIKLLNRIATEPDFFDNYAGGMVEYDLYKYGVEIDPKLATAEIPYSFLPDNGPLLKNARRVSYRKAGNYLIEKKDLIEDGMIESVIYSYYFIEVQHHPYNG